MMSHRLCCQPAFQNRWRTSVKQLYPSSCRHWMHAKESSKSSKLRLALPPARLHGRVFVKLACAVTRASALSTCYPRRQRLVSSGTSARPRMTIVSTAPCSNRRRRSRYHIRVGTEYPQGRESLRRPFPRGAIGRPATIGDCGGVEGVSRTFGGRSCPRTPRPLAMHASRAAG